MEHFSLFQGCGGREPSFSSDNIFSSNSSITQHKRRSLNFVIDPESSEFSNNKLQNEETKDNLQEIVSAIDQIMNETPDDKEFKHWNDLMQHSRNSIALYDRCIMHRDYDSLKNIQSTLAIKSGHLIAFINWVKEGNVRKFVDKSKLCYKYKETVGTFPKVDYGDIENKDPLIKAKILEKHLEQELIPILAFEEENDVRRFIMHLEHCYQATFRKKTYIKYLGIFHYVCPYLPMFPNCKFHLKFTKYFEGHYTILVSHCFLHSHDPWIKICEDERVSELYGYAFDNGNQCYEGLNKLQQKRDKLNKHNTKIFDVITKPKHALEDTKKENNKKQSMSEFIDKFNQDFTLKYKNNSICNENAVIEITDSDGDNRNSKHENANSKI